MSYQPFWLRWNCSMLRQSPAHGDRYNNPARVAARKFKYDKHFRISSRMIKFTFASSCSLLVEGCRIEVRFGNVYDGSEERERNKQATRLVWAYGSVHVNLVYKGSTNALVLGLRVLWANTRRSRIYTGDDIGDKTGSCAFPYFERRGENWGLWMLKLKNPFSQIIYLVKSAAINPVSYFESHRAYRVQLDQVVLETNMFMEQLIRIRWILLFYFLFWRQILATNRSPTWIPQSIFSACTAHPVS